MPALEPCDALSSANRTVTIRAIKKCHWKCRTDLKKRYSGEQIVGFLREAESGIKVKDPCRRHGFSEASFYAWRSQFGGMEVSDAKRLGEQSFAGLQNDRRLITRQKYKLQNSLGFVHLGCILMMGLNN